MKPSELSRLIGIAASTIRAWSAGEYRVYLTPSAQGGDGASRQFTALDARIFLLIAQLKQRGATNADIHAQLRQMQAGDWQELPELPAVVGASLVPVIPESTAAAALESQTRALLREVAGLQKQLEQLQSKLDGRDETILELTRRLAGAETELRLYREGRIKPDSPA